MAIKKTPSRKPHLNSMYTSELGEKICFAISTTLESITELCKSHEDFPGREQVWKWRIMHPEFGEMYTNAKRCQADLLVEQIIEIADDKSKDTIVNEKGEEHCDKEWVQRTKVRIDTRKWLAAKLLPRIYGENISTQATVTIKHEDALKDLK